MRTLVTTLLVVALCGSAAARTYGRAPSPGARRLQSQLVRTVRQHNQQLKSGQPAMDLGLVFRLVGRTLERTNGDQLAAARMAVKAARWSTGRSKRIGSPRQRQQQASQVVRALRLACKLHQHQVRKGTSIPYISHLLGVAGIVMRSGGSEREVIAALLHDAVEDQGGTRTLRQIRRRFGRQVAGIVEEVTEPRGQWRRRKQHTIDGIASGRISPSGLRVKLADALHNSGTMTREARVKGDAFWGVFTGKKAGSLWYFDAMLEKFKPATARTPELRRLTDRLERQVTRLHAVAGKSSPACDLP
jgi:GTP pyrophosphokinase